MREVKAWIFAVLVALGALFAGYVEKNEAPVDGSGCAPGAQQCDAERSYGMMEPSG